MSIRIHQIERAVQKAAGCAVQHLESTVVVETFRGRTVWEGVVEVFALSGHPLATKAYGWNIGEGQDIQFTVVLEIPPVNSPSSAVRASIVAERQRQSSPN